MIGSGNGYIGFPVTRKVQLPEAWETMLAERRKK
jgi:hypothetical protein